MTVKLTPRKEPRQGRARATVDAILEAAARLTRELGVEPWTTNQVADLAGVSIGSLYQYFPNKESLVTAWLVQRREARLGAIADALTTAIGDKTMGKRAQTGRLVAAALLGARAEEPHLELELRRFLAAASADRKLAPQTARGAQLLGQFLAHAGGWAAPPRVGFLLAHALEASLDAVARENPAWLADPAFEADLAVLLERVLG